MLHFAHQLPCGKVPQATAATATSWTLYLIPTCVVAGDVKKIIIKRWMSNHCFRTLLFLLPDRWVHKPLPLCSSGRTGREMWHWFHFMASWKQKGSMWCVPSQTPMAVATTSLKAIYRPWWPRRTPSFVVRRTETNSLDLEFFYYYYY